MVNSSRFFWFFLVNGVLFLLVFLFFPETYDAFSREDHVIENATAIALLLAGVLLIRAGIYISPQNIRRYSPLLLIVGLIFIIGAGEEISWGQRIFNWETPEALAELNDQNETNLHNINKKFFDRLVDRATILFVFFASFLLLRNKKSFKGIPYPDGLVILAFAITPFYHQYNELVSDFYFLLLLPLLALLFYGWQANKSLFRAVLLTFAYLILMSFTHYTFNEQFADHNNSANEYREYLFSLACLFYAYQIQQFNLNSTHA